ncbi:hypothetical protein J6590_053513 [Homalodisca vitripennis]|nr:hypothetical protein J6590_053513 [Homalodisca vitripennis]
MSSLRESGDDKQNRGLEMKDRHPRFQVNRVATVDGDDADEEELAELYDEEDDSPGSYVKSFRHFTREALPRMDNYRNIMSIQAAYRPTLDELHQATLHGKFQPCSFTDSGYLIGAGVTADGTFASDHQVCRVVCVVRRSGGVWGRGDWTVNGSM